MIQQIVIARDTARKARTSAIIALKALLVTAPTDLREDVAGTSDKALIDRCASLRPGAVTSPTASAVALRRARGAGAAVLGPGNRHLIDLEHVVDETLAEVASAPAESPGQTSLDRVLLADIGDRAPRRGEGGHDDVPTRLALQGP